MQITILDTKTKIKKTIITTFLPYWWAEGNGSCDCNRAIKMNCTEELDKKMRKKHPELKSWQSLCYGCKRFLIIQCDNTDYSLEEYNSAYPKKLKQKYMPQ